MMNKDSLIIFLLLYRTLTEDYKYKKEDLFNQEQLEKLREYNPNFQEDKVKQDLLKLFNKYLKKL